MTPAAVAVFVKSPGRSPIKTRLARDIGEPNATAFYLCCVRAVEAVLRRTDRTRLTPYWAVAEPDATTDPLWRSFTTLPQGPGTLGDRLAHVYATLLARHPAVLLAGADAPLLTPDLLETAASAVLDGPTPFAISRSADGGYSLFAGSHPIPRDLWTAVPYSTPTTAAEFVARLTPIAPTLDLPPLDDIDTLADLPTLLHTAAQHPLPDEHRRLLDLTRHLLQQHKPPTDPRPFREGEAPAEPRTLPPPPDSIPPLPRKRGRG